MFGAPSIVREWHSPVDPLDRAKATLEAAFEFFQKLGVDYYCFHDRDIAPEGNTFAESCRNLQTIVQMAKQLQKDTGIKVLWGTANLFGDPIYSQGAATSPNAHVMALAAAQVKNALDATNGARRRELRVLGRTRGIRDTAEYRHQEGTGTDGPFPQDGGRLQKGDRIHGTVPDRTQAEGAHEASVRFRRCGHAEFPPGARPARAFQAQHRSQSRARLQATRSSTSSRWHPPPASSAVWMPTVATCFSAGIRTSSRPISTAPRWPCSSS